MDLLFPLYIITTNNIRIKALNHLKKRFLLYPKRKKPYLMRYYVYMETIQLSD